ncbi:Hypothetical predicted protein, partial [Olea europaea subsp. europaea]
FSSIDAIPSRDVEGARTKFIWKGIRKHLRRWLLSGNSASIGHRSNNKEKGDGYTIECCDKMQERSFL